MINLTPKVQLIEVLWTLVVLYGLIYSILNLRVAIGDRHALRKEGIADPSLLRWAAFSVSLHTKFTIVDIAFLVVGVIAMLRRPSPDANTTSSLVLAGIIILAVALLSQLTREWKKVDDALKA